MENWTDQMVEFEVDRIAELAQLATQAANWCSQNGLDMNDLDAEAIYRLDDAIGDDVFGDDFISRFEGGVMFAYSPKPGTPIEDLASGQIDRGVGVVVGFRQPGQAPLAIHFEGADVFYSAFSRD